MQSPKECPAPFGILKQDLFEATVNQAALLLMLLHDLNMETEFFEL